MELINKYDIPKIFVGRQSFLEELQYILDSISEARSGDFVLLLLNTPGIGKTKTIEHFGKALMNRTPFKHSISKGTPLCEYALYVQITITYKNTLKDIFESIIKKTYSQFKLFYSRFPELLPNIWNAQISSEKEINDLTLSDFIRILELESIPYQNPSIFLITISEQIPIILHLDEFQETIHTGDKKIYNDIGSFLSGILKSKIFCIITGTKFTIIRTIGNNRISPLNGKTETLVLLYLSDEEQQNFASKIISKSDPNCLNEQIVENYFSNWIRFYSGGHPRTMEKMSRVFIDHFLPQKIELSSDMLKCYLKDFFSNLNSDVIDILQDLFWKSKYKDLILEKTQNIPESLEQCIIRYIGTLIETDRKLPKLIVNIENEPKCKMYYKEQIEDFISILV